MDARKNTHLVVLPKVVLTPTIEPVIIGLNDDVFKPAGKKGYVTSGLRTEVNQLQIIQNYAVNYGVAKQYGQVIGCNVQDMMDFEGQRVYKWQPAWSMLLHKGIIVNPPKRAKTLFSYNGPAGRWINPSPHFKGTCFDVGGGEDGIAEELSLIQPCIGRIWSGYKLVNIVIERKQNCIHVDCIKVS